MTQHKPMRRFSLRKSWVLGATLPAFLLASGLALSEARAGDEAKDEQYAESRDATEVVTDGWITTKVKSRLIADGDVSGFDISVETRDNVVYLSGEVDNQSQVNHAVKIARDTEGVETVDATALRIATAVDQVRGAVGGKKGDEDSKSRDATEAVTDGWITTKVKSKLFVDQDVSGFDISVETRDKVVYLSGEVDNQSQVNQAIDIARNTEGVQRVDATALRIATAVGQARDAVGSKDGN
jgi:hyperosmotically inducible periplasmic protein